MPARPKISKTMRRQLTHLADQRCSYCRSPEWIGIPMVIEHILPLTLGGLTALENLCLSCYRCNEYKGSRIEGVDPVTGLVVGLFHPREQIWAEHFAWSDGGLKIVGLTARGRVTAELLRLNNEWLVSARRIWIIAGLHPPLS